MAATPTVPLPLRAEPATVKSGSPKHRGIRRRQSQRAPGIREWCARSPLGAVTSRADRGFNSAEAPH
jgi:hypothetical protein